MQLLEGAKISQQILQGALSDPNATLGIEAEFFLAGAQNLIRKHLTSGLQTMDTGESEHYVKKLGDIDWTDVVHFFTPLGVGHAEIKDNHEILRDRLTDEYQEMGGEGSESPNAMWNWMKGQVRVHELMALLRIFPEYRMVGVDRNNVNAVRDIVYDGDVEEIRPFGKLNEIPIALAEVGNEAEDLDPTTSDATRAAFYELVAEDIGNKLGVDVTFTTDEDVAVHEGYTRWFLTKDSSLDEDELKSMRNGRNSGVIGLELVSPVMQAGEGLEMMMRVLEMLNGRILGLQVVTTEKTGLHVNLGVEGKEIDPIKVLVLSGDDYILDKFDRAANINSQSIMQTLQAKMRTVGAASFPLSSSDVVAVANKLFQTVQPDADDMRRAIDVMNKLKPEGKSHSINFEKLANGYVEYRAIGNRNYQKRAKEVRDAVLHMIGITAIATEPDVYRREYLKKLYALVGRVVQDVMALQQQKQPVAASVGMIGRQAGNPGGYNEPLDQYRETPYDGEQFMTQYGFDAGSDTQ